jgi:hypothetical protein
MFWNDVLARSSITTQVNPAAPITTAVQATANATSATSERTTDRVVEKHVVRSTVAAMRTPLAARRPMGFLNFGWATGSSTDVGLGADGRSNKTSTAEAAISRRASVGVAAIS